MTKPIIALDLDGTLLSMGDLMHPKDKEILTTCTDVDFVFASGRQHFGIRKSMAANDLFTDIPIPFPMVLINGGALYLPGEELLEAHPFTDQVQEELIQILEPFNDIPFLWQSLDQIYLMHPTPFAIDLMHAIGVAALPIGQLNSEDPFYKIICWSDEKGHLAAARRALHDFPVETFVSMDLSVEFNPKGINKGEGLQRLLNHINGGKAEIFAVGDSENDLPLFKCAKTSFVPATAPLEIQKQAQVVIDPAPRGLLQPILERLLIEPR
jgi:hypothetical protein